MRLCDIQVVKTIMEQHGIHFQKKFGQNFLVNPAVPARIAQECGAQPQDAILEIGPGIGTLTQELAQRYRKVVAVEIDRDLIGVLHETMADYPNVTVIEGDIMKTDLRALFDEYFSDSRVSVCANLPYYITSPILMKLLESGLPFDYITVMIQREVAQRLCAAPGSDAYGAITACASYYASVQTLFPVSKGNFIPVPKVDSAVIRMQRHAAPPVSVQSETMLFRVIRAAFEQRRKTLVNALSAGIPELEKSTYIQILQSLGMDENIRGEKLSLQQFADISNALFKRNSNGM